jgi:hypothetical protein
VEWRRIAARGKREVEAGLRRLRPPARTKAMLLHVPKTAGISVREVVARQYPGERCVFFYDHTPEGIAEARRAAARADAVYGHYSFGFHEQLGVEGRYHTILREPIARVVSCYRHHERHDDSPYRRMIAEGMTLREMVESGTNHMLNNHMTRILGASTSVEPVFDRALLETALANVESHFGVVGLTERLGDTMDALSRELGWRKPVELPRLNTAPEDRTFELDDATLDAIHRFNALDIELYERMRTRFESQLTG